LGAQVLQKILSYLRSQPSLLNQSLDVNLIIFAPFNDFIFNYLAGRDPLFGVTNSMMVLAETYRKEMQNLGSDVNFQAYTERFDTRVYSEPFKSILDRIFTESHSHWEAAQFKIVWNGHQVLTDPIHVSRDSMIESGASLARTIQDSGSIAQAPVVSTDKEDSDAALAD
jgi:hypothetical protein